MKAVTVREVLVRVTLMGVSEGTSAARLAYAH